MKLYEDDSHIIEEQEQRDKLLESAINNENNISLLCEAINDAVTYMSEDRIRELFREFLSNGEINNQHYANELVRIEIDDIKRRV